MRSFAAKEPAANEPPQASSTSQDINPLDRLESAAEVVMERAEITARRVMYERGNRLGLLWVHAVVGMLAGTQQLLWGSATQIEAITGPHMRLFMGPLAMVGGIILAAGLISKPRSIPMEAIGLGFIACWDFCMTVGLAYARWSQHDFHILPVSQPMVTGYVPAYPVAVYGGMFALLVIHLLTLRHLLHHVPVTP